MAKATIRIDPRRLSNPDADLRYALPDVLRELSNGAIRDDGYEYEWDDGCEVLVIYLDVDDPQSGVALIERVLADVAVLGNHLGEGATVEIEDPATGT